MNILLNIMITVHATVAKTTDGRTATWRFMDIDGVFAAIGDNRKIIPCESIDHMRNVYNRYVSSYGFIAVKWSLYCPLTGALLHGVQHYIDSHGIDS